MAQRPQTCSAGAVGWPLYGCHGRLGNSTAEGVELPARAVVAEGGEQVVIGLGQGAVPTYTAPTVPIWCWHLFRPVPEPVPTLVRGHFH